MRAENVFVAGATGFCGRSVVAKLTEAGIATVAHVRPDSPERGMWAARFSANGAAVDHTAWQPQAMHDRLQQLQPTIVFSLLGTTLKRARQEQLSAPYEAVDFALTAMLIDAAAALPAPPLFVYLSSAGAAPSQNAYLAARHRAEEHLRHSNMPYLIARPGLFTGARDEPRMAEQVAAAILPAAAGLLRLFGAKRVAAQVRPMTGPALAASLVAHALAPDRRDGVLEAIDLQAGRAEACLG